DGGEGHFVAVLKRLSPNNEYPQPYSAHASSMQDMAEDLYYQLFQIGLNHTIEQFGNYFLLLPKTLPYLKGLGVIRAGVLLGEAKTNRIEPAHAAFMSSRPEELNCVVELSHDSKQIFDFLRGEEIEMQGSVKGFAGVAVDGVVTGFGKCSNGRLKNHYPKGLRNN
ncbi:MAG: hypothetical protein K0Q85_779, partial [Caproiciproducens sp.]|nr:hypothetical protein [Caproiciproducens sp.]